MTRSMTISSSNHNKLQQTLAKTPPATMQLPDIIPSASTPTASTPTVAAVSTPIITSVHVSCHLDECMSRRNPFILILGSDNTHCQSQTSNHTPR